MIGEIIDKMDFDDVNKQLVKEGKIRYFGLSSLVASRLEKCISKDNKLFNLDKKDVDKSYEIYNELTKLSDI